MESQYIKNIRYGNFYINILPALVPLILWIFFIYNFYYPYLKLKPHKLINNIPLIVILILPFYLFLFGSGDANFNKIIGKNALAPILFKGCFSQANKNLQEKGIIGIWDYECAASQVDYLHEFGRHISERFYYVNYALLLFMLIYGKIKSKKSITDNQVIFVSITLLFGIIGTLVTSFTDNYVTSLMLMIMFSTILNINVAAFLFALVSFAF